MQHLIKQYFWLVGALTMLTCSFFTAKAVGHVIEGKVLTDAAVAPKITAIPGKSIAPKEPTRSKDGAPLADRERLFEENLDRGDPWQFKNFRVI